MMMIQFTRINLAVCAFLLGSSAPLALLVSCGAASKMVKPPCEWQQCFKTEQVKKSLSIGQCTPTFKLNVKVEHCSPQLKDIAIKNANYIIDYLRAMNSFISN